MSNDENGWQRQLLSAALLAGSRTAVEYLVNPEVREQTMGDVLSRLSEVDYDAIARSLTGIIDQAAGAAKNATSNAIESWRTNMDEAVEAAAERAQEQLGQQEGGGGLWKWIIGLLFGVGIGYVLLNEDRRNQIMDMVTGASGPIQSPPSYSSVRDTASDVMQQAQQAAQSSMQQSSGQSSTSPSSASSTSSTSSGGASGTESSSSGSSGGASTGGSSGTESTGAQSTGTTSGPQSASGGSSSGQTGQSGGASGQSGQSGGSRSS